MIVLMAVWSRSAEPGCLGSASSRRRQTHSNDSICMDKCKLVRLFLDDPVRFGSPRLGDERQITPITVDTLNRLSTVPRSLTLLRTLKEYRREPLKWFNRSRSQTTILWAGNPSPKRPLAWGAAQQFTDKGTEEAKPTSCRIEQSLAARRCGVAIRPGFPIQEEARIHRLTPGRS